MAFTVEDFRDLARLLEQRPEWRAELRRLVLTDELLELPALVRDLARTVAELAEAQRRTDAGLAVLTDAQRGTEERVGVLAEAERGTKERLGRLETAVAALAEARARADSRSERVEGRLASVEGEVRGLRGDVGDLREDIGSLRGEVGELREDVGGLRGEVRGRDLEWRYRSHGDAYFGRLLRRIRVLRRDQVGDLLDAAVDAGALDEDAADEIRRADLIARGRQRDADDEAYLVVEVSAIVDRHDVERAADRAALLGRYRPALAAVAGGRLTEGAVALAAARGVWQVTDGKVVDPSGGG